MSTLDPERWRAASAELDGLLELQPSERATYLAALRQRAPALAGDVERLLEEHRAVDAEAFLQEPPAMVPTGADDATRTAGLADSAPRAVLAGGTRFGAYRIVRPLGRGGMGAVYEADEVPSGRRVALKILKERLHDPRERERFSREGRLAASLNHPHCVFVFAASEVDGRLAIAMELMHSSLLTRRFARAGQ
jgi:hypothetical protein